MQAFEAAPSRVLEIALDDAPALPTGSSTEASDSASAGTEKDTKVNLFLQKEPCKNRPVFHEKSSFTKAPCNIW